MDIQIKVVYGKAELVIASASVGFIVMPDGQGRSLAYLKNNASHFDLVHDSLSHWIITETEASGFTELSLGVSIAELSSLAEGLTFEYPEAVG